MPENGIACNCHMARKLLNNKNSFYERVEFTKILGTKPHKLLNTHRKMLMFGSARILFIYHRPVKWKRKKNRVQITAPYASETKNKQVKATNIMRRILSNIYEWKLPHKLV